MTTDTTGPDSTNAGPAAASPDGSWEQATAADGTTVSLDPGLSPETLRAWRHAAVTGALPAPSRDRWQQLRAGVVNMWEFDAAEYWTADGRAQFVGGNEQGKSTMMTMTTLTMLTGDLSPRYVDTFGESHRTFRYYLEPTDDPKDRRPTKEQLNRGWTWVEYGRLTENGPEYFTALLFVQARRTSPTFPKTWITHRGPERVRDGLTLVRGQATVPASDLPAIPGFTRHENGQAYTKTIASVLFGFSDPHRLRTVVELLKTLRTPKLGNRLNPGWVIDRIREALPPLESAEINELADGWDQLGQLAQDRDDAREAQEAVTAYLRSAWNPWADAVIRRAADDLVSAVTVLDDVTRERGRAEQREEAARADCEAAIGAEQEAEATRQLVVSRRETLLQSQAYRAAAEAGRQVADLAGQAKNAREDERSRTKAAVRARETSEEAAGALEHAQGELAAAEQDLRDQADQAGAAGSSAGIPDAPEWAREHDSARLLTAIRERFDQVRHARRKASEVKVATGRHESAVERLADAEKQEQRRREAHEGAEAAYAGAAQALSDELEAWATTLDQHDGVAAPSVAVRDRWLESVREACELPRPSQTLARMVRDDWLTPALAPVTAAEVTARNDASAATAQAMELDALADQVASAPATVPADPHLWSRRVRPTSGPEGAPLWELLDPVAGLADDALGGLEAALAGAGLLDAWVTPDGVWSSDRDGHDHVLTLTHAGTAGDETAAGDRGTPLSAVLAVAEKALDGQPLATLAAQAQLVLDAVTWHPEGLQQADLDAAESSSPGPAHGPGSGPGVHVCGDGSWVTPITSGRALPAVDGASLLGTSAREAARARRVASLREQAKQQRDVAAERTSAMEQHQRLAKRLADLAASSPDDAALVDAARGQAAAFAELEAAVVERARRNQAAEEAELVKDRAQAELVAYAAEHNLAVARLEETQAALHAAEREADRLAGQIRSLAREQRNVTEKQTLASRLDAAATEAEDLARQATTRRKARDAALDAAQDALDSTDQELLSDAERLKDEAADLEKQQRELNQKIVRLSGEVAKAAGVLEAVEGKRSEAEAARTEKLAAWWVPIDIGLAAARQVDTGDGTRTLTAAVHQARTLRTARRAPRGWPDSTAGTSADKDRDLVMNRLRDRLSGPDFIALNNTLTRTGGRSAVVEHDESTGMPQVRVLIDSSDTHLEPVEAVTALAAKAAELGELHDEQMHEVMQELLSSTFVDHLRTKVKETEKLINDVNVVLGNHPTGTTRTVVRLQRKAVAEHVGGYQVLQRLLTDGVDSPAVQEQVQTFLAGQIRAAQDEGHATGQDWKDLLVDKLDYRNWFAVVTEWRVLSSAKEGASLKWTELTAARHGQDSGGGKVMTMVQPLLATLATLYQTSQTSPRPLWLDEAFDGLDPGNISSLLGMLVEFDFDFLLAGPKTLVASRQVPCAAVWMVNRAPAPLPGVDLGLWLFAGGSQERVTMAAHDWREDDPKPGNPDDTGGAGVAPSNGPGGAGEDADSDSDNGAGLWE